MLRYLFILALLLSACKAKETPPEGILSEEQMVDQLTEYYIVEDKIVQLGIPADSAAKVMNIMTEKLVAKTGIQDSLFRRSLEYYILDPVKLERIYGALVDSLNLKEQRSSLNTGTSVESTESSTESSDTESSTESDK
jgi:hypothetical protein